MKQVIRLKESELKRMINESIRQTLNEGLNYDDNFIEKLENTIKILNNISGEYEAMYQDNNNSKYIKWVIDIVDNASMYIHGIISHLTNGYGFIPPKRIS